MEDYISSENSCTIELINVIQISVVHNDGVVYV